MNAHSFYFVRSRKSATITSSDMLLAPMSGKEIPAMIEPEVVR